MKIIAGRWRGKTLTAPATQKVRPTSDKGRQALFNMLESRTTLREQTVLDVFAGTGALGLEALSRGAEKAIFNDTDLRPARKNIHHLQAEDQCVLLEQDALSLGAGDVATADIVFMDPPYARNLVPETLMVLVPLLKQGCFIMTETEKTFPADTLPFTVPGYTLTLLSQKSHGAATLSLLRKD